MKKLFEWIKNNPSLSFAFVLLVVIAVLSYKVIQIEAKRSEAANELILSQNQLNRAKSDYAASLSAAQAKTASDSAKVWENKYVLLDSIQKASHLLNLQEYETYKNTLLTDSADAARLHFLSKRFPDLYPKAGF